MSLREFLRPVRIVLVDTALPENIGSAARAMKTMGLSDLALVRPKLFPDQRANAGAGRDHGVLREGDHHPPPSEIGRPLADEGVHVAELEQHTLVVLPRTHGEHIALHSVQSGRDGALR